MPSDAHVTYDQRTVYIMDMINWANEHFPNDWRYRGIEHWLQRWLRAAIPIQCMALQVLWVDSMAMAPRLMQKINVPLLPPPSRSALTAVSRRMRVPMERW